MTEPDPDSIRVNLGPEVTPGIWLYRVEGYALEGRSRQPLLDACRQLKSLGVDTDRAAGLFRSGRDKPDLSCSIRVGAATTVLEDDRDRIRFGKFRPFTDIRAREAV